MSEDLLHHFLAEGRELVERASEALLQLDDAPGRADLVDEVFRALHTLKGSTGLFDMAELGAMLHAAESRLEAVRSHAEPLTPGLLRGMRESISESERWLDALDRSGKVGDALRGSALAIERRVAGAAPVPVAVDPPDWVGALVDRSGVPGARTAVRYLPSMGAYFRGEDPLALLRETPGLLWIEVGPRTPFGPLDAYAPFDCNLALAALSSEPPEVVRKAFRLAGDEAQIAAVPGPDGQATDAQVAGAALRTLRIEADRVDVLAGLVAELVIAKNALAHETDLLLDSAPGQGRGLAAGQLALDRAVAAVHAEVARLRLAPLGQLLGRLPRQTRELADSLGKDAELVVAGADVAVDKAIIDGLFEPMLHLLRNALDHGIEAPDERRRLGKPDRARICLSARAAGDLVVLELADDGRGLDLARIRETAVRRGTASAEAVAALSDDEAAELIFSPGFSTARAVSAVSGRGVGLDAVRTAVSRLGGRVGVESMPGRGVTFRIELPLRMVLTKAAVVAVGDELFGVPLRSIGEVVRVERRDLKPLRSGQAFILRDQVVPLVELARLVGAAPCIAESMTVLVVGGGADLVGVAVDRLAETVEAPLRAVSGLLSHTPGLQGTIVRGDGGVLLVLDLMELVA